jgi:single-strand DNA-binding protein
MVSVNKVLLAGNMTADPALNHTNNGTPVVNFRLASNRKAGDKVKTCFIDCAAFGAQAEAIMQYCSKGSSVLVEAQLDEDQWTADNGEKRFKHYLTAQQVSFLSRNDTPPTNDAAPAVDTDI